MEHRAGYSQLAACLAPAGLEPLGAVGPENWQGARRPLAAPAHPAGSHAGDHCTGIIFFLSWWAMSSVPCHFQLSYAVQQCQLMALLQCARSIRSIMFLTSLCVAPCAVPDE
jgi:hypothetical protein